VLGTLQAAIEAVVGFSSLGYFAIWRATVLDEAKLIEDMPVPFEDGGGADRSEFATKVRLVKSLTLNLSLGDAVPPLTEGFFGVHTAKDEVRVRLILRNEAEARGFDSAMQSLDGLLRRREVQASDDVNVSNSQVVHYNLHPKFALTFQYIRDKQYQLC